MILTYRTISPQPSPGGQAVALVMTLTKIQEDNRRYFLDNLDGWLKDLAYRGKYVVIYNRQVRRVQDDFAAAFRYAVSNFPREEFIVQQVVSEDSVSDFLSPAS